MTFNETELKGVYEIQLQPQGDERGFFVRNFAKEEMGENGISYSIVHINRSFNKLRGTTRGFHYQDAPKSEDKILQCLRGRIYDVVIDLRDASETYGKWIAVELSSERMNMVLCPKGCANGIQTLEDNCELQYFVSEFYSPGHERGIRWNDPYLAVKWPLGAPTVISVKDATWPLIQPQQPPKVRL
jgi:dTDP-4-dehydrorhamnose 3,5-epimerase